MEQKSIFERYPGLTGGVVLVVLMVLFDLLAGWMLIPDNFQSFRIRSLRYHHGIEPYVSSVTNWGQKYYTFHSNSLGFRDSCVREVPLTTENRRILFMGDSHTEAVGIDYSESFTGLIGAAVKDRKIDVLNGSAVSYSPKIHYLKCKYLLEDVGLDVDEIFVVIDMSDLNNEIAYRSFEPKPERKFVLLSGRVIRKLAASSATVYLADRLVKQQRNKFFNRNMATTGDDDFELYATFFSEFRDADLLNNPDFHHVSRWLDDEKFRNLALTSLEIGQSNIEMLKQLCDKREISLTISVHPWPEQILKGDTTNLFVESWRSFAQEQEIGFINLYPLFINEVNPVLVASQNYIHQDNHWNENGHRLVAGKFLEVINAGGK